MRGHTAMIMFIATIIVAAGAVLVIQQASTHKSTTGEIAPTGSPEIVEIGVRGITNRQAQYITVTIAGGDTPVSLSDTTLLIKSAEDQHSLSIT